MSDDDALGPDMHLLLGFLEAEPPVADQDLLERLLDGRLDPGSVPPGYGGLARLLAAATAPAAPDELAGEQLVMAEFGAVMRSHAPTLVPRRTAVPRKLFTMKAAAAALVAVLSVGGVAAAATGLLPGQASPVTGRAPATTTTTAAAGQGVGAAARVDPGGAAQAGATHAQGRESAVGPDATAAARAGLCRAWQAGEGADHGHRADSVAFQALVAAAGGADKVAAYCERTWPPAAAQTPTGRVGPRHRAAAHPRTQARPPAPGLEGTGGADPRPPADSSSALRYRSTPQRRG